MGSSLFDALAALCEQRLHNAGYRPPIPASDDPEAMVRSYFNVIRRSIVPRPRRIHRASEYGCPPGHRDGEALFLERVERGAPLRPHQSTRLENSEFDDGLFNEFGIHHFHLGTQPHPRREGLVERTPPLLYAVVRRDDFFAINVLPHGQWGRLAFLDTIHATWPFLLDDHRVRGAVGLARVVSDEEHLRLRNANINTLTQRPDGTVHWSPGGGMMTTGMSAEVVRGVDRIQDLCAAYEQAVVDRFQRLSESRDIRYPLSLSFALEDGEILVREDRNRIGFRIPDEHGLIPPPL